MPPFEQFLSTWTELLQASSLLAHLPSILLSTASSSLIFYSLKPSPPLLCLSLSHHPAGFSIEEVFFRYKQVWISSVIKYTVSIVFRIVGNNVLFSICAHLPLEHLDGVSLQHWAEWPSLFPLSDTSHLLPVSQKKRKERKKTQIFHIKITQQINFNYGWSETKCFIRCGWGDARRRQQVERD